MLAAFSNRRAGPVGAGLTPCLSRGGTEVPGPSEGAGGLTRYSDPFQELNDTARTGS